MALKASQRSLKSWTKQKWRTKSGKPSKKTGERYLPTAAIKLYHPKSTQRQLELKEKAQKQVNNSSNSLKASLKRREVIEKLHNIGYFENDS